MKKIIDFNEFLTNKLFEEMTDRLRVNELELILSKRLQKILKEIDHVIADDLLSMHSDSEIKHKVTFVDLGIDPNKVSFISSNKVPDNIEPDIVHGEFKREFDEKTGEFSGGGYDYVPMYRNPWISDPDHIPNLHFKEFQDIKHDVWTKNRIELPINRFINKLFPNKYIPNRKRVELDQMTVDGKKWDDVESFKDLFVSSVEAHSKQFQIKKGEELRDFYRFDHYFSNEKGTLASSCMKGNEQQPYLDLYANNPDKISLLVLFPEDEREKIIGRALVWKLDNGRTYMDRIYTNESSDEFMFIEYAKSKGYLYKSSQSYGWDYDIVDGKDGSMSKIKLSCTFSKPQKPKYYAYVDTLQFYNPDKGHFTNDKDLANDSSNGIYYRLTSTSGGADAIN